jgi:hypothetical protein
VGANDDSNVTSPSVECGVWLTMSSLPGTGIGMFAGQSFKTGDDMMEGLGDHIIPIVDFGLYHSSTYFLWDEYTWVRQQRI